MPPTQIQNRTYQHLIPVLLAFIIAACWIYQVQHDPFFWDSVQLGSKHAHFFYNNALRWQLLPPEIDSGHPPLFGYYLAVIWTVFGKSLPVSHWAMLPFLAALLYFTYQIGRQLTSAKWAPWLVLIICADPVLASQSALVGPDILLACFFVTALYGALAKKQAWLAIGVLGMCVISMRGMMTAGGLFLWHVLPSQIRAINFRTIISKSGWFFPGFLLAAVFLLWHLRASGWIGFHPDSPWAPAFQQSSGAEIFKNILVLGWRMLDFGRVFEWLLLIGIILQTKFLGVGEKTHWKRSAPLVWLFLCLVILLSPSALMYQNLSAHRYFIPLFLVLHFIVFQSFATLQIRARLKQVGFGLLVAGLFTGNLWIYPHGISMGWDATLAHRHYHDLRSEMMNHIDQYQLDFRQIGTAFPNINTGEDLHLNGDSRIFAEFNFERNQYMLVSNVYNDVSAEDLARLHAEWALVKHTSKAGVWLSLYKRKSNE